MADKTKEKWTEIELLPQWEEKYYDVYTARKHGKWVMLKTLKQKYKADPRMQAMFEKEFEVRYNLSHPNIVMINDYEEVPGLGLCIITDDVYGTSLRTLIDTKAVTPDHIRQITTRLVDAIDYIQTNHIVHFPIRPETIIFTENIGNLKLIDVGFDQAQQLSPAAAAEDIHAFGRVLSESLAATPEPPAYLQRIADRCTSGRPYASVHQLRMALARRSAPYLYIAIIAFLLLMFAILAWLTYSGR